MQLEINSGGYTSVSSLFCFVKFMDCKSTTIEIADLNRFKFV
ncbi:MAG: hypothetical protein JWP37_2335 [Mucilaginibacter sp.]|nr:hypothetical protein [Mucilaginibacter sp.]